MDRREFISEAALFGGALALARASQASAQAAPESVPPGAEVPPASAASVPARDGRYQPVVTPNGAIPTAHSSGPELELHDAPQFVSTVFGTNVGDFFETSGTD